jgi:hypothetical protein
MLEFKVTIYMMFFVLFCNCSKQNQSGLLENNILYTINLEECLAVEQIMKISEIADTVEYIALETPEDITITRVWDIIPVDSFWIIHSRDGVYKFTDQGKYIKNIGRQGQGPGEYSLIYDIAVDPIKKEILLNTSGILLFYDLEGTFLRMMRKDGTLFRASIVDSVLWISETAMNTDKYLAYSMDYQGKVLTSIPNPCYAIESQDEGTGLHLSKMYKPFYNRKDTIYLKGKEVNDTIYQLSGSISEPYVAFNMGKYKLPVEYESWYSFEASQKNGSRYWGIPSVAEDERYLFLLAQRYAPVDGDRYVHNEDNFRYIIYDKSRKLGFRVNGKLQDDVLGGPSIWPYWITDNYYMSVIECYDLLDEIKKSKYFLSSDFKKQISSWGYDTNPLVIVCRK